MPWKAMCRLRNAFSDAIDCPKIHLPVFWIPAIPAGMTVLRHSGRDCRNPVAMDGNLDSSPCVLDTGNPCRYDGALSQTENCWSFLVC